MVKLKSEVPVAAMGEIAPADGHTVITYDNPHSLIYKPLIVRGDILVGAHLVGDILPGGGYPSVINFGYRTAHLILEKEKKTG